MAEVPAESRFVIVGGGVHGLSTAWHLAQALRESGEEGSVVLLERDRLGSGASGISGGIVRNYYRSEAMTGVIAESVGIFESDPEGFGFHQVGYLAVVPEGQRAVEDMGEITAHAWLTPGEALQRAQAGEIQLPPPTWTTLRQIEQRGGLPGVLAWAQAKPIVRVSPVLLDPLPTGERVLALPGDPAVPMVEGWDVPPETRFVMREGQGWLPVRPQAEGA